MRERLHSRWKTALNMRNRWNRSPKYHEYHPFFVKSNLQKVSYWAFKLSNIP